MTSKIYNILFRLEEKRKLGNWNCEYSNKTADNIIILEF